MEIKSVLQWSTFPLLYVIGYLWASSAFVLDYRMVLHLLYFLVVANGMLLAIHHITHQKKSPSNKYIALCGLLLIISIATVWYNQTFITALLLFLFIVLLTQKYAYPLEFAKRKWGFVLVGILLAIPLILGNLHGGFSTINYLHMGVVAVFLIAQALAATKKEQSLPTAIAELILFGLAAVYAIFVVGNWFGFILFLYPLYSIWMVVQQPKNYNKLLQIVNLVVLVGIILYKIIVIL